MNTLNPDNIALYKLLHQNNILTSKSELHRNVAQRNILLNDSPIQPENYNDTFVQYTDVITVNKVEYVYTPIGLVLAPSSRKLLQEIIDDYIIPILPKSQESQIILENYNKVFNLFIKNKLVSNHYEFYTHCISYDVLINGTNILDYNTPLEQSDTLLFKLDQYLISDCNVLIQKKL